MFCGLHLSEDGLECAVWSNEEGGTFCAHVGFAVHAFWNPNLVSFDEGVGFVGEQGKGRSNFLINFLWL